MKNSLTRHRTMCGVLAASLLLMACPEKGPAEKAGEKVDKTAHAVGDKMEDVAKDVGDAMK